MKEMTEGKIYKDNKSEREGNVFTISFYLINARCNHLNYVSGSCKL